MCGLMIVLFQEYFDFIPNDSKAFAQPSNIAVQK